MTITHEKMQRAISLLAEHGEAGTANALKLMLADTKKHDLIDRNAYLASILWQKEDLEKALRQNHYKTTDENIAILAKVLPCCSLEERSIEAGWYAIDHAVWKVRESLEREVHHHDND